MGIPWQRPFLIESTISCNGSYVIGSKVQSLTNPIIECPRWIAFAKLSCFNYSPTYYLVVENLCSVLSFQLIFLTTYKIYIENLLSKFENELHVITERNRFSPSSYLKLARYCFEILQLIIWIIQCWLILVSFLIWSLSSNVIEAT